MHASDLRADTSAPPHGYVLLGFSHLRWNFVFQRPQQLMARFARTHPVVFWEEPIMDAESPHLELRSAGANITLAVPHLPPAANAEPLLRGMLDRFVATLSRPIVRWYYTPMMLGFSRHVRAAATVYDCMDELANFKNAPPELQQNEAALLALADLVFTGGYSLYEAKRAFHPAVHAFPSSVDRAHFGKARKIRRAPEDQAGLERPRLGFFGVIDERMDLSLVAALADAHPEWNVVMVGPLAKIDASDLPRRANIAWLGPKEYRDLPAYLAGWDVALMPFAINEATRFISPTKTPEYLAGGVPVVSTRIADVVRSYGGLKSVRIADTAQEFIAAAEELIATSASFRRAARREADTLLAHQSWDATVGAMQSILAEKLAKRAVRARVPGSGVGREVDEIAG